eukprot:TRINITY_DN77416_c0_g1_i1.p2 TRINITY_DN77416_c0_g1~~TRINITY_DN77416_c0_g1_i1.p2  ORF type:complete len:123 (+),score=30.96 TRINITY_DN77416_c0_g1_i1:47-370(+)
MADAVVSASGAFVDGDVLIVGHAGYLSFLALKVVEALAPTEDGTVDGILNESWLEAARTVVLDANVGEVCGFEITSLGARYLPNPESTDFDAAKHNDAFVVPAATAA